MNTLEPETTVEVYEHGLLVRGGIPVSILSAVAQFAKALGWDFMDAGVSTALRASLAIVSLESGKAWRAAIDAAAQRAASQDPVRAWLNGTDTGLSAKTLCFALTGHHQPTDVISTPWDVGDVGRCVRFLDIDPSFRARLPEVAERIAIWRPFVARWAEIESAYDLWLGVYLDESAEAQDSARRARLRVSELCEACAREMNVLR